MPHLPGCQKSALSYTANSHKLGQLVAKVMKKNWLLIVAEILVMGGILTAFIAPLLVPSEQAAEMKQ